MIAERRFHRRADRVRSAAENAYFIKRRNHLSATERAEFAALVLAAGIGRILLCERVELAAGFEVGLDLLRRREIGTRMWRAVTCSGLSKAAWFLSKYFFDRGRRNRDLACQRFVEDDLLA